MQVRGTELYMDELTGNCNGWKEELMRHQSESACAAMPAIFDTFTCTWAARKPVYEFLWLSLHSVSRLMQPPCLNDMLPKIIKAIWVLLWHEWWVVTADELKRLNSVKANKLRLLEHDRPNITAFTNWVEAHKVPRCGLLLHVDVCVLENHCLNKSWLQQNILQCGVWAVNPTWVP